MALELILTWYRHSGVQFHFAWSIRATSELDIARRFQPLQLLLTKGCPEHSVKLLDGLPLISQAGEPERGRRRGRVAWLTHVRRPRPDAGL